MHTWLVHTFPPPGASKALLPGLPGLLLLGASPGHSEPVLSDLALHSPNSVPPPHKPPSAPL